MAEESTIGRHIAAVAAAIFGKPNERLSKKNDQRYGSQGSFSVRPDTGQWFDHESKLGGGVLDLIQREKGLAGRDAIEWMRSIGCHVDDRAGYSQPPNRPQRAPDPRDDSPAPWDDEPPQHAPAQRGHDPAAEALRNGPTKVYPYEDLDGKIVLEVCRYEWIDEHGEKKKTFRQRRPPGPQDKPRDVRNGYVWNLKDTPLVPYRLPKLWGPILDGETLFLVEGEKDADTLAEFDLASTCNPQGAGKWPDELTTYLQRAKRVVLFEDNDAAGRNHVAVVGAALKRAKIDVRVVDFRDQPEKSDVTDWIDAGATEEELLERIANARPWYPEVPKSNYGALRWQDIDEPGPEVEWLWDGYLTENDKSIIGGESQAGKSFLAINLGLHIAMGTPFLGAPVSQGLVCYQAGESARGARRRLKAFRDYNDIERGRHVPFVLLSKRIDLFSRDSGDVQGMIDEVKSWQAYYINDPLKWVCIDTLARASIGAEENSAKDMGIVLDNIDKIEQALQCAVSAVHHLNAAGGKLRGSTAVFANVEQVLGIARDPETKVRTLRVTKMKDEADGGEVKFELRVRDLGVDSKGKKVTSCVVVPSGQGTDAPEQPSTSEKKYFRLRKAETDTFLALLSALREHGEIPPAEIMDKFNMPPERRVVRWAHVVDKYAATTNETDPDEIAKILSTVGSRLRQFRVLERQNPYIWWTGKPVDGFPETYPDRQRAPKPVKDGAGQPEPTEDDMKGFW